MNNRNIVRNLMTLDGLHKILFGIVAAVIVVGWSLTSTITNVNTQKAGLGATSNTIIVLQSPLYTEDDVTTSQKAIIVNGITHARTVTFTDHGMTKGVNYTDGGEGLIIPRGFSGVIESKGYGAIKTSGGEASFTFHEIGNSESNGRIRATGAAFFDSNTTGKLAFLNNVVAVYIDQIYKNGTYKITAWKWK